MHDAGEGAGTGFKQAATRFAGEALGLLQARIELAGIELAQERERLLRRLLMLFAGVWLVLFGILGLCGFVVVHFWETNRMGAILGASLACAGLGALLIWRAAIVGRNGGTPFAQSSAEFAKDRAQLVGARESASVADGGGRL